MDLKAEFKKATQLLTDRCEKHNELFRTHIKSGKKFCLWCEKERIDNEAQDLANAKYVEEKEKIRLYFMNEYSLMNETLKNASFENYVTQTPATKKVLEEVKQAGRRYLKGARNNLILTGNVGVGKSHLAYSLIKSISNHTKETVIFMNVVDLIARIKADFTLEDDYIRRLSEADYLVLDDLGLEKVTEWSTNIIYSILDKRERTIITTNFNARELEAKYNKQTVSRLNKGVTSDWVIKFDELEDYRQRLYEW